TLPKCTGFLFGGIRSSGGRSEEADPASKQIGPGMLDSASFRSSHRMRPHEDRRCPRMYVEQFNDATLGATGVGDQNVTPGESGSTSHILDDPIYGGAYYYDFGVRDAESQFGSASIDRAALFGPVQ